VKAAKSEAVRGASGRRFDKPSHSDDLTGRPALSGRSQNKPTHNDDLTGRRPLLHRAAMRPTPNGTPDFTDQRRLPHERHVALSREAAQDRLQRGTDPNSLLPAQEATRPVPSSAATEADSAQGSSPIGELDHYALSVVLGLSPEVHRMHQRHQVFPVKSW
jgi:hypothetical protein